MCYQDFSILIPLRGGSKSIPRKNVKLMAGKPLCFWVIEAALKLSGSKVYVSTEDYQIRKLIEDAYPDLVVIDRPVDLSMDDTSTEAVVDHFLSCVDSHHVILMQATSPLTCAADLQEAIALYLQNDEKSLITCVRKHQFVWSEDGIPLNYDPHQRPRRQDWNGCLVENGAFYIFSKRSFQERSCRCTPPATIYEMPAVHSVEIDEPNDWIIVESLLVSRNSSRLS